jgi:hypothetical protein
MSAICRRSWPSMSAISTTGARIVRSDNVRPARRSTPAPRRSAQGRRIIALPVLGGLHHVYQLAA